MSITASGGTPPYRCKWNLPNLHYERELEITTNGLYQVTVIDSSSHKSVLTVNVEINFQPFIEFLINEKQLIHGETLIIQNHILLSAKIWIDYLINDEIQYLLNLNGNRIEQGNAQLNDSRITITFGEYDISQFPSYLELILFFEGEIIDSSVIKLISEKKKEVILDSEHNQIIELLNSRITTKKSIHSHGTCTGCSKKCKLVNRLRKTLMP